MTDTKKNRGAFRRLLDRLVGQHKARKRKRHVLKHFGCACFCPACKDILNDQAEWSGDDDGHGTYACKCGNVSEWHFGIAPVPICLRPNGKVTGAPPTGHGEGDAG